MTDDVQPGPAAGAEHTNAAARPSADQRSDAPSERIAAGADAPLMGRDASSDGTNGGDTDGGDNDGGDNDGGDNDGGDSDGDGGTNPDGTPRAGNRRRRRGSRGGRGRNRTRTAGGDDRVDDDGDDSDDTDAGADDAGDAGDAADGATTTTITDVTGSPGSASDRDTGSSRRAPGTPRTRRPVADEAEGAPAPARARSDSARSGRRPGGDGAEGSPTRAGREGGRPGRGGATRAAELPDPPVEGRILDPAVADAALVKRSEMARRPAGGGTDETTDAAGEGRSPKRKRGARASKARAGRADDLDDLASDELDAELAERRRGRERKGRAVGRYLMCVHVSDRLTQIAVLEGRSLIEHYVARPSDDVGQIHGNIYVGRVQNVLPGMEAAFVDIATPKNAVLYHGDVQYDAEDIVEKGEKGEKVRIEQVLKPRQIIVCQVTKNPIGVKGARLTQEVSLPGRFVVLIPNSKTYGISKRLPDDERKRLRAVLDKVKPAEHGIIVRTAAEGVVEDELRRDVQRLLREWNEIDALARKSSSPRLLYREPDMAVRVIREEFNKEYRGIVIDDRTLYEEVRRYVEDISPHLADRVQFYDAEAEGLPLFERNHIHEQLHKALDRKVWLPSGGSLVIEHTEALTVIDVNTGKNVGSASGSLEETVFRNNLEAADEIARQLRLRDVGGIIVIDFIDMEIKENRNKVVSAFREALARDKTRTQVFEISELGLVEMTRKRIGEGLLTSFTEPCPMCQGRGVTVDHSLLD